MELTTQDDIASKALTAPSVMTVRKEKSAKKLQTMEFWSSHFRIAGWQQAALARLMNWENGKQVDEQSYTQALHTLTQRRMGN